MKELHYVTVNDIKRKCPVTFVIIADSEEQAIAISAAYGSEPVVEKQSEKLGDSWNERNY